ncbi:MAG: glycosyltransferase, partial [Clostridia bacterium]|nr:glycosyltransferase [Clostridia bacterium]
MMEKILIVNNNMDIGGIQKSLLNLLRETSGEYDITLLLMSRSGALLKSVPPNIKVITPARRYRMLGLSRDELRQYPLLMALKWLLKKYAALFSRRSAMRVLGVFQKKIRGYDRVISYSHLTSAKGFDNGCGDFVLDKTVSPCKICFVHCDYSASGYCSPQNNAQYGEFDRIACCSDSVRARFTELSGVSGDKVRTVRNFWDSSVLEAAQTDTYEYDKSRLNVLTVARLSPEKGVDLAIDALHASGREDICYCLVGDGPEKSRLEAKVKALGMESRVVFAHEQANPYR